MATQIKTRFKLVFRLNSTLPLYITGFTANSKNGGVLLNWNVADEKDITQYLVQRSSNGEAFEEIASVKSYASYNTTSFSSFDASPLTGNSFYRIKAINKNGFATYSGILKTSMTKSSVTVYPNPARGNVVNLQINELPKGLYRLELFSLSGQMIYQTNVQFNGQPLSQALNTGNLVKTGFYNLVISGGDERKMIKIMFE